MSVEDTMLTNAASFREAAAEYRRLAETQRYRRYAIAHGQVADSLESQAAALEAQAKPL